MANNENEFRKIFLDSAKSVKSIHIVDIPDDAKRIVAIHPECANLIAEKAYDLGLLRKGKYLGIELKNESRNLTWNISELKPHQKRNLLHAVKCGGHGFVLVRFKKALSVRDRKRLNTKKFAIDIAFACDIVKLTSCKLTSFSIEYMLENFQVLELNEFTKKYDLEILWKISPKK